MCGRYMLTTPGAEIAELFCLRVIPTLAPRFNVAPTQRVPVVRMGSDGQRDCVQMRWGLVPGWSKDLGGRAPLVNARSETVADKPSFRTSFARRRCLLPANGFYEWASLKGRKQPHLFRVEGGRAFAFAALWDQWNKPAEPLQSCALLTCEANSLVGSVHPRMPVILRPEAFESWLEPGADRKAQLLPLCRPFDAESMTELAVGLHVNSPKNDDPKCIEPV